MKSVMAPPKDPQANKNDKIAAMVKNASAMVLGDLVSKDITPVFPYLHYLLNFLFLHIDSKSTFLIDLLSAIVTSLESIFNEGIYELETQSRRNQTLVEEAKYILNLLQNVSTIIQRNRFDLKWESSFGSDTESFSFKILKITSLSSYPSTQLQSMEEEQKKFLSLHSAKKKVLDWFAMGIEASDFLHHFIEILSHPFVSAYLGNTIKSSQKPEYLTEDFKNYVATAHQYTKQAAQFTIQTGKKEPEAPVSPRARENVNPSSQIIPAMDDMMKKDHLINLWGGQALNNVFQTELPISTKALEIYNQLLHPYSTDIVMKLIDLLTVSIDQYQTVSTLSKAIAKRTLIPSTLDTMISIGENDAHLLKVRIAKIVEIFRNLISGGHIQEPPIFCQLFWIGVSLLKSPASSFPSIYLSGIHLLKTLIERRGFVPMISSTSSKYISALSPQGFNGLNELLLEGRRSSKTDLFAFSLLCQLNHLPPAILDPNSVTSLIERDALWLLQVLPWLLPYLFQPFSTKYDKGVTLCPKQLALSILLQISDNFSNRTSKSQFHSSIILLFSHFCSSVKQNYSEVDPSEIERHCHPLKTFIPLTCQTLATVLFPHHTGQVIKLLTGLFTTFPIPPKTHQLFCAFSYHLLASLFSGKESNEDNHEGGGRNRSESFSLPLTELATILIKEMNNSHALNGFLTASNQLMGLSASQKNNQHPYLTLNTPKTQQQKPLDAVNGMIKGVLKADPKETHHLHRKSVLRASVPKIPDSEQTPLAAASKPKRKASIKHPKAATPTAPTEPLPSKQPSLPQTPSNRFAAPRRENSVGLGAGRDQDPLNNSPGSIPLGTSRGLGAGLKRNDSIPLQQREPPKKPESPTLARPDSNTNLAARTNRPVDPQQKPTNVPAAWPPRKPQTPTLPSVGVSAAPLPNTPGQMLSARRVGPMTDQPREPVTRQPSGPGFIKSTPRQLGVQQPTLIRNPSSSEHLPTTERHPMNQAHSSPSTSPPKSPTQPPANQPKKSDRLSLSDLRSLVGDIDLPSDPEESTSQTASTSEETSETTSRSDVSGSEEDYSDMLDIAMPSTDQIEWLRQQLLSGGLDESDEEGSYSGSDYSESYESDDSPRGTGGFDLGSLAAAAAGLRLSAFGDDSD